MATFEDVQKFADDYGFKPIHTKPEFKSIYTILLPGERLKAIIEGTLRDVMGRSINGNGVVIVTDLRLIFYQKTMFGSITKEEYSIDNVTSASCHINAFTAAIEVRAGSNKATVVHLKVLEAEKFVNILNQAIYSKPGQTAQASQTIGQPAGPSIAEQLEKFFELKEKGILTEEEFNIQKARLLR